MFNKKSLAKNHYMLNGKFKKKGYDWWWHSFTARNKLTGEEKPFFIEFFIINPGLNNGESIILGQEENNQVNHIKPSYLMVKCGTWGKNKKQLHRFFPLQEVTISNKNGIHITADDCYLDETTLKGTVSVPHNHPASMMCDEGSMSFDLKIKKEISYNVGYGTSSLFRFLKAFEMYWHAQGMKSLFEGNIVIDGEEFVVDYESSYGYADKNWGSNFTSPWVWLSSNNMIRKSNGTKLNNSVFDIGGGKPKAFGITFKRKLLGAYFIEGKEYEMNFSKFWHPSKTEFDFNIENNIAKWKVIQQDKKTRIVTSITCDINDMLFVNYEAPDGSKKHKQLYNGGNGQGELQIYKKIKGNWQLEDEILVYNVGCEYGEFATN